MQNFRDLRCTLSRVIWEHSVYIATFEEYTNVL